MSDFDSMAGSQSRYEQHLREKTMKSKPNGPDAGRKCGGEGLNYTPAAQVAGGPIENDAKGSGLGEGKGVNGSASLPPVIKGKGGPKK